MACGWGKFAASRRPHMPANGSTGEIVMRRWMGIPLAAVALTACVAINVYFPAAEAKEAAREFVEKVIGDDAQPAPTPQDKPGGQSAFVPSPERSLASRIDWLSLVGIGTAHAQGQPDITIKTP